MPRRKRHFNFNNSAFFYDSGDPRSFNETTGNLTDVGNSTSSGITASNSGVTVFNDSTIVNNRVMRYEDSSDRMETQQFAFQTEDRFYLYCTFKTDAGVARVQTIYADNTGSGAGGAKLHIYRPASSNNLNIRYGRPSVANTDVIYTNFFLDVSDRYITLIFIFIKSVNLFIVLKNGTRLNDTVVATDALFPNANTPKYIGNVAAGGQNVNAIMHSAVGVRPDSNIGNITATNLFQYRFRSFDPDAAIFSTACSALGTILPLSQQRAINFLVRDLKQHNLWGKLRAVYPFIGGTAGTHSINLKQPRIFGRISWVGGVTHDANGVTFNGTTGYGNLNFNMGNGNLTPNATNLTMGMYSRTSAGRTCWDMGVNSTLTTTQGLLQIRSAVDADNSRLFGTGQTTTATITDGSGLHAISRQGTNSLKRYQNGVVLFENTTTNTGVLNSTQNMLIGCRNNNGTPANFSNRNICFAFIASGIVSDYEMEILYKAVQKYNSWLGRQTGTPIN